jgi:hypothetical protein
MNKLNFKRTGGPYGDATSSYDVSVPKGMTLEEFIKAVIDENPEEWGDIQLGWNGPILIEYNRGNLFNPSKELSENLHKEVVEVKASGGWSLMSYHLILKDPEPEPDAIMTYDKDEYWGHWLMCQKCGSNNTPAYGKYCCECGHKFEIKHDETRIEWNERYCKELKG